MIGRSTVPPPIPYQGSKRQIAGEILRRFPARVNRLVEPFAGSAAISLAMAAEQRAERIWLNDANEPLISLWREIVDSPEELADAYERLWHEQAGREREFFDLVRARFNARHDPADLLYLLARCVKAAVRYNAQGEFNNSPDNRRRGTKPELMRQRLVSSSRLLIGPKGSPVSPKPGGGVRRTSPTLHLTDVDYRDVLSECRAGDLVYLDPPYRGVSRGRDQRYLPAIHHEEFCEALAEMNCRGIMYAVSYDGRTGDKTFGEPLPESLELAHLEILAGRSSQATLLGRQDETVESLYLSPALGSALEKPDVELAVIPVKC